MKSLIQKIFALYLMLNLSSCYTYETSSVFSSENRLGYSTSKPIFLSVPDTKQSTLYFILTRNMNTDDFFLKVRWVYKNGKRQFKKDKSTIRFLIDRDRIISADPIKPIRTMAYNIDKSTIEEEAVYKLTREDLTYLVNSKSVTVNLTGKYENKVAYFSKLHTYPAFKNFLINS